MQIAKEKFSAVGELAIPFVAFLTLYTSTICGASAAALDSIYYLVEIDNNLKLVSIYTPFHPHHLLYKSLVNIWITLFRLTNITLNTEFLVALLNAVFGALTLCVFYWLLRKRLQMDRIAAFIGTALPAFSFGFWFYSVCIEVYIIPLFFLMLSFYSLTSEHITKKTFALVGISHGLAVLFHQVNVLFMPVVFLAAFFCYKHKSAPLRKFLTYYAVTFLPTIAIPYLLVIFGFLKLGSPGEILYWLTIYAHKTEYWSILAPFNLIKAGIGLVRSIIGANFIFAIPKINLFIDKISKGHCLMDDVFLVRDLNKNTAYIFLGLSIILLLIIVFNLLTNLRSRHLLQDNQRKLISLALAWFTIYGIFFFCWVSVTPEFWIPQSICLWLILLASYPILKTAQTPIFKKPLFSLSIIAVLLFILNFSGGIKFIQYKSNDFYYHKITPLVKMAKPNDLIIIGSSSTGTKGPATSRWDSRTLYSYLLQYTKANVLSIVGAYGKFQTKERRYKKPIHLAREDIKKLLAKGNSVFVFKEALELNQELFQEFDNIPKAINSLRDEHQDGWQRVDFGTNTIYIIKGTLEN